LNYTGLRQGLAEVYVQLGRCADALAVLEQSVDQPVGVRRGIRGFTYAKCDRRAQALTELSRLRQEARDGKYVSHYSLAVVQAGLGDNEEAIAELERAYTEHVWSMFVIKREPAFIALRSDPRFTRLVRRMALGI
jgi:predicted negative regulator of RcsB-dependent stress response